jgi:hypothetical protein
MDLNIPSTENKALVRCAVTCPLCSEDSEQYRANSSLFWHADHDIDLQPIGYHSKAGYETLHPHLHHMWHCSSCWFTAPHTHFSDPMKNAMIQPQIVTGRLRELSVTDGTYKQVTELLLARVSDMPRGYLREIALTLLAILQRDAIEALLGQGFVVPAGYAMRLAWLHRDLAELPDEAAQTLPLLQSLHAALLPCWAHLPSNETEALELAMKYHADSLQISGFTRHEANEISALRAMGRICIKLDRIEPAREHLISALHQTRDVRAANTAALAKASGSDGDPTKITSLSHREQRLRKVLHECEELVEIVHTRVIEREDTRAQALLASHQDAPPAAIRQLLTEAGIPKVVVDRYAPAPKKSGFLSRLMG